MSNFGRNGFIFSVKLVLRIFLFLVLFSVFSLKVFKVLFFSYNKTYKNEFLDIISQNNVKFYNIKNHFEESVFNNRITVVNILYDTKNDLFNNFKRNKVLATSFGDKINILDIVIKNKVKEEVFFDEIFNILDNGFDNFIKTNKIKNPIVYFENSIKNGNNILSTSQDKILIFDEKNNLKSVFDKNVDSKKLRDTIVNISKDRKFLKKTKTQLEEYKFDDEEDFFGDLRHFIVVENNENYDFPFFAILDSDRKQILLTNIGGGIFNIVELNSLCYPNNLKSNKSHIYVSDSCDGSIYKILLKENKVELLVKSPEILNIADFDFTDENNIFIAKDEADGLLIYNIKENTFRKLSILDKIGPISNVIRRGEFLYFFDYSNDALYSYGIENGEMKLEINLKIKDKNVNIDYFSMSNRENIYFLNKDFNRIFVYNEDAIKEKNFGNFLNLPRDLKIFRNYFYFLSDNYLQKIDFLSNSRENINLFFSKNFNFNLSKLISEKIVLDNLDIESIKNNNFKINLVYNSSHFVQNSPSFLLLFRKEDSKLFLVKKLSLGNEINYIEIDENYKEGDYILYGKIYYKNVENNLIKIKKVKYNLKLNANSKKTAINIII